MNQDCNLDLTPDSSLNEEYDRACKKCGTIKKLEDFPLNGDPRGGRRHQCKVCMREINRKWRENKAKAKTAT